MNAAHLINRNTRAHSSGASTAWHLVAAAHEATIRDLVAQLNTLQGINHTPQAGCVHRAMALGESFVLVEFEVEEASGDGFEEPRYERTVSAIQALINGVWVDMSVIDADVVAGWEADFLQAEADDCAEAAISATQARREELFA